MSSTVIIVLAVVGGLILLALAGLVGSRLKQSRERRRARLSSEAAGHRQEAEAHAAKAQELGPKAEVLTRRHINSPPWPTSTPSWRGATPPAPTTSASRLATSSSERPARARAPAAATTKRLSWKISSDAAIGRRRQATSLERAIGFQPGRVAPALIAIAGGAIVNPVLFVLGILALVMFVMGGRGRRV